MNKKILFLLCLCLLSGCTIGELDFDENRTQNVTNNGSK